MNNKQENEKETHTKKCEQSTCKEQKKGKQILEVKPSKVYMKYNNAKKST